MNIKRAVFKVFSVNFLQLISGLIIGFLVPVILSIEGYANLKTYSLYVSYIGLFHFGFIDGLFIKYGGKKYEEIDKRYLKGEHNFLIIMETIISVILFIISLVLNNIIVFLFAISVLPIMISNFHKYIYQATGDFNKYTKITYVYVICYMILNITLALLFRSQNYIYYCLTTFIANLLSILGVEFSFIKSNLHVRGIINKRILDNIKVGFFILLGNLAIVGLFGIDKWFVKLFMTTEDFAYYSFAVSMLNIVNILINAISITFYNYLFENNNEDKISELKSVLLFLGGISSCAYFALSFIVNHFIGKYINSLSIIAITFSVFPYMILINALFLNLYKVNKDEKHYLKVMVSILVISIIYNIIALIVFNSTTAIAVATVLTLITWVIYSSNDLENVNIDKKTYLYMFGLTVIFLLSAHYMNWLVGGISYALFFIIWSYANNNQIYTILKKEICNLIKKTKNNSLV